MDSNNSSRLNFNIADKHLQRPLCNTVAFGIAAAKQKRGGKKQKYNIFLDQRHARRTMWNPARWWQWRQLLMACSTGWHTLNSLTRSAWCYEISRQGRTCSAILQTNCKWVLETLRSNFFLNFSVHNCGPTLLHKIFVQLLCTSCFPTLLCIFLVPTRVHSTSPEQFLHPHFSKTFLVVLAIEVGGRWSREATTFLRLLAPAEARTILARLTASFPNSLIHQRSAQITHAAMTAYAASLLEFDCVGSTVTDGNQPLTSDLFAEAAEGFFPPPTHHQPSPRLDLALSPCTSPVYKWHMPGSCPAKQLQPAFLREKKDEEEKKKIQHFLETQLLAALFSNACLHVLPLRCSTPFRQHFIAILFANASLRHVSCSGIDHCFPIRSSNTFSNQEKVFFFSSRSFLTARRSKGTGLFYWAASRHRLFLYWPVSRCAFGREGISPDLPLPGWEATARLSWAGLGEEVFSNILLPNLFVAKCLHYCSPTVFFPFFFVRRSLTLRNISTTFFFHFFSGPDSFPTSLCNSYRPRPSLYFIMFLQDIWSLAGIFYSMSAHSSPRVFPQALVIPP